MSIDIQETLVRLLRKELPEKPGVYLFRDRKEDVVYIGKSINLKKRVLSYFHKNSMRTRKKLKPLLSGIDRVEFHETHNEFLALLLEDKLIKKYYPFYNVRQKKFRRYKYLALTNGLFPTLKTIDSLKKVKNMLVYGPFQGKAYIDALLDIILKYYNLRLCKESNPTTKCVYHDLKYCVAPCILNIMPVEYTGIVNKVQDFLDGNINHVIPLLEAKLNRHIEDAEFENAQEIKNRIEFINTFAKKQKFFNRFRYGKLEIYEESSSFPLYTFIKGRLRINDPSLDNKIIESNNRLFYSDNEIFNDSKILLDRANIVYNWLTSCKNSNRYILNH